MQPCEWNSRTRLRPDGVISRNGSFVFVAGCVGADTKEDDRAETQPGEEAGVPARVRERQVGMLVHVVGVCSEFAAALSEQFSRQSRAIDREEGSPAPEWSSSLVTGLGEYGIRVVIRRIR